MTAQIDSPVRMAALNAGQEYAFVLTPDAAHRDAIARELGLLGLRKLRFVGTLRPEGRRDWRLEADLGASIVQSCGITLAPVPARIDERVQRRYLARLPDLPPGDEIEMPDDDTIEPQPEILDLTQVMIESLALALPLFPRAEGVSIDTVAATPPDAEPLDDGKIKPFAGLAALKKQMERDQGEDDTE